MTWALFLPIIRSMCSTNPFTVCAVFFNKQESHTNYRTIQGDFSTLLDLVLPSANDLFSTLNNQDDPYWKYIKHISCIAFSPLSSVSLKLLKQAIHHNNASNAG